MNVTNVTMDLPRQPFLAMSLLPSQLLFVNDVNDNRNSFIGFYHFNTSHCVFISPWNPYIKIHFFHWFRLKNLTEDIEEDTITTSRTNIKMNMIMSKRMANRKSQSRQLHRWLHQETEMETMVWTGLDECHLLLHRDFFAPEARTISALEHRRLLLE